MVNSVIFPLGWEQEVLLVILTMMILGGVQEPSIVTVFEAVQQPESVVTVTVYVVLILGVPRPVLVCVV